MSGEIQTTFELSEIIMAVALFLIIITAIFYVKNPDFINSKATSHQISYISSLISGSDTKIQIKTPKDSNIKSQNNIIISTVNNIENKKEYIGEEINIKQSQNSILIS